MKLKKKLFRLITIGVFVFIFTFNLNIPKAYASGTNDLLLKVHIVTSNDDEFYIPTDDYNYTYNYNVDCNNDGTWETTGETGDYACTYSTDGDYVIRIEDNTGNGSGFPFIFLGNLGGESRLLEVQQWGTLKWQSMFESFMDCPNLVVTATDIPDLSNVDDMSEMFSGDTSFNTDINNWDVSNVGSMSRLFYHANSFNQPLNNWNVSNVYDMSSMFEGATAFNQNISNWDTFSAEDMTSMFNGATNFNQDLSNWDISNVYYMDNMLDNTALSVDNYDNTLIGWDGNANGVQNNVTLGAAGLYYCNGENARNNLISSHSWTINDAGKDCSSSTANDFIIKIQTNSSNQFTIPVDNTYTYNYNVDCDNNGSWEATGVTSSYTCSYGSSGQYSIRIGDNTGNNNGFPHLYFGGASTTDRNNLLAVKQWGTMEWEDMSSAFSNCSNVDITATDTPDLSGVTTADSIFYNATSFNANIDNWDVSHITNMHNMFYGASNFNQPLNSWNVSSVTNMADMFENATNFNQPLNNWNVGNVNNMYHMFAFARNFNQDISSWDVSNVVNMEALFGAANAFNQPLNSWNVSNVTNMSHMFASAIHFNQDISAWNVSHVSDMSWMFYSDADFNQPLNNWNVGSVTDMSYMFNSAQSFNQPLNNWNVGNVTNMNHMFYNALNFNGSISTWNVANVTDMSYMFSGAYDFNQDINSWNVTNVTNMGYMFNDAQVFNHQLNSWNVSNVINMDHMFSGAHNFNQDISNWNVSNVTNMNHMFSEAHNFNQNISSWDISNVSDISWMFANATHFNQPLSNWNVLNITDMSGMFYYASAFNQDISNWNVSNVTDMSYMFNSAQSFNQPLNNWNVSNVTNMAYMFYHALDFNQSLDTWDVSHVTNMTGMLDYTSLYRSRYDKTLTAWNSLSSLQNNVTLGASGLHYCKAESARNNLISTYNWTINDDGKDCSAITLSGDITASISPDTVNTETIMTIDYTLPDFLDANAKISVMYDDAFTGGSSLTNSDISVSSTKGNIGTCTADNFSDGYFDITCTGTAETDEVLTITIGNTHKLTTPSQPGNYDPSVLIDNNNYTYMQGATLAYVGDDNDVNVTAYVPSVIDMEIYEAGTNANTNSCDLGVLSVNKVNSCSYDVAAGTNNSTGLSIKMHGVLTSDWATGSSSLTNTDGVHTIPAVSDGSVTAGYSEYGFKITNDGSNSYTASGNYATNDSAVPNTETTIASTATTVDGINDSSKRLGITHYASMSNSTISGNYSHGIIFTAYTN